MRKRDRGCHVSGGSCRKSGSSEEEGKDGEKVSSAFVDGWQTEMEKQRDGKNPFAVAILTLALPRAVNTQALSGAGILRMVNKAADAVNKMTIKMNESDALTGNISS